MNSIISLPFLILFVTIPAAQSSLWTSVNQLPALCGTFSNANISDCDKGSWNSEVMTMLAQCWPFDDMWLSHATVKLNEQQQDHWIRCCEADLKPSYAVVSNISHPITFPSIMNRDILPERLDPLNPHQLRQAQVSKHLFTTFFNAFQCEHHFLWPLFDVVDHPWHNFCHPPGTPLESSSCGNVWWPQPTIYQPDTNQLDPGVNSSTTTMKFRIACQRANSSMDDWGWLDIHYTWALVKFVEKRSYVVFVLMVGACDMSDFLKLNTPQSFSQFPQVTWPDHIAVFHLLAICHRICFLTIISTLPGANSFLWQQFFQFSAVRGLQYDFQGWHKQTKKISQHQVVTDIDLTSLTFNSSKIDQQIFVFSATKRIRWIRSMSL